METLERKKDLCRAWFQAELTDEDRSWLAGHIQLAGQEVPTQDISWITMEWVRA